MIDQQLQGAAGILSKALHGVAMALCLAMFASVIAGLTAIADGLWSLIWHGHYAGQEFRLAVHMPELQHKVFKWDKAWWFTLILPALAFQIVELVGGWSEWLALTPAERQERREKMRAESKHKGDEVRAALRAREDRDGMDKAEWRRAKMNKRPMSGWRRLWIVLSVVFGVPVFAIAYDNASRAYVYEEPSDYVSSLRGQAYVDAFFNEASRSHSELKACILSTARVDGNSITCDRDPLNAAFAGLGWALLPAIIMLVVGLTVRWVYRGFRMPRPLPEAHSSESI